MKPAVVPFPERKHACPGCNTPTLGAEYCIDCRLLDEELNKREIERFTPPTQVPLNRREVAFVSAALFALLGGAIAVWALAIVGLVHLVRGGL